MGEALGFLSIKTVYVIFILIFYSKDFFVSWFIESNGELFESIFEILNSGILKVITFFWYAVWSIDLVWLLCCFFNHIFTVKWNKEVSPDIFLGVKSLGTNYSSWHGTWMDLIQSSNKTKTKWFQVLIQIVSKLWIQSTS